MNKDNPQCCVCEKNGDYVPCANCNQPTCLGCARYLDVSGRVCKTCAGLIIQSLREEANEYLAREAREGGSSEASA